MTAIDLHAASWAGRGGQLHAGVQGLEAVLSGINAALVEADRVLGETYHMSGIGYVDRSTQVEQVASGLGVLVGYVSGMPLEIKELDYRGLRKTEFEEL